jgi:glycosyltransferase involved in cell wall biosynthesis
VADAPRVGREGRRTPGPSRPTRSLGAAGRDRARTRYSWNRIAGETLRIYDRMVPAGYSRPTAAAACSDF